MAKLRIETQCDNCKKTIYLTKSRYERSKKHFCCKECYNVYPKDLRVEKTKNVYRDKIIKGRRTLYHRYIMEQHLGRQLERNEHVHHINGDKQDNRIENLMVVTAGNHNRIHQQKYPTTKICKICGKEFEPPVKHRKRNTICSKECWSVWQKQTTVFKPKKINQYTLGGEYIRTFGSIKEASDLLGKYSTNIVKCLKGITKQAYGYKWEYID